MGRCPGCGEWDTLEVEKKTGAGGGSRGRAGEFRRPVPMNMLEVEEDPRLCTGIREFDRVLGGGIVAGTLVLIGGDPGIGKSTLMLQALSRLAFAGRKALYISGEESIRQLKMRGNRLGAESTPMLVAAETDLDAILAMIDMEKPDAVVVDSIQSIYLEDLIQISDCIRSFHCNHDKNLIVGPLEIISTGSYYYRSSYSCFIKDIICGNRICW